MDDREELLNKFLEKWPIERLQSMTLEDYALGGDNYKDSFSYWIEIQTKSLGDIGGLGGGGSFKHGIYAMSKRKEYTGNKRMSDDRYAWSMKYGSDAISAFNEIKSILLQVVQAAIDNNLDAIDMVDFYAPVKWKWAFLYSDQKLISVFKKEALEVAANHLGYSEKANSYPELYRYIRQQKMKGESIFLLSDRVWNIYLGNKPCNYYIIGSKYGGHKNLDVFPEMFNRKVISTGFASSLNLEDFICKSHKEIVSYLRDKNEDSNSFSCLKYFLNIKPGDKIAVKADGSPKGSKGFLSIVGIAEAKDADEYYGHDPKGLGHTIAVEWLQAPVYKEYSIGGYGRTIHKLNDQNVINEIFNTKYDIVPIKNPEPSIKSNMNNTALNQILYGPPGTGKTYSTINKALDIIHGQGYSKDRRRDDLQEEFNTLKENGQIQFTTFHQSFSYEDFVEGIRPVLDDDTKDLGYDLVDGIFMGICKKASQKFSNFDDHIERLKEKCSETDGSPIIIKGGSSFEVTYRGGKTFRIKPENSQKKDTDYPASIENIRKVYQGAQRKEVYNPTYVVGILDYLYTNGLKKYDELSDDNGDKNYVLIIDEINRGNVASIFGELITLLEPDKRQGAVNELTVTLPYSRDTFGVPSNLYVIGTMNTADRSVEALDTALRRRFSFTEMRCDYDVLDSELGVNFEVDGIIVKDMLETINNRLELLLNRDHQIGHAWFLSLKRAQDKHKELERIFRDKIIPLLQEFFYADYGKIGLVLGSGFVAVKEIQQGNKAFACFEYDDEIFQEHKLYEIRKEINWEEVKKEFGNKVISSEQSQDEYQEPESVNVPAHAN